MVAFAEAKTQSRLPESVLGQPATIESGDAEAALAAAEHIVDLTYHTARHSHNAIELHAVTLHWTAAGDLVVHDASQAVVQAAWTLAQVFGIEERQVHVSSPYGGQTLRPSGPFGALA
jgi:xanthine dehydrogenase YagR molybdenum-binding subunit